MKERREWLSSTFVILFLLVVLITVVTVFGIGFFHLLGYSYTDFSSVLLYFGCFVLIGLPLSTILLALVRVLSRFGVIRSFAGHCLAFGALDVFGLLLLLEVLDVCIGGIAVQEPTMFLFALLFCLIQLVVQNWGKPGDKEKKGGQTHER